MPRCYMVKKACNKYQSGSSGGGSSGGGGGGGGGGREWSDREAAATATPAAASGPVSPTEASMAPSSPGAYYRPLDAVTTATKHSYLHEFIPHSLEEQPRSPTRPSEVLDHDGGIPIFRQRSPEETEAAHDLLELARSLPPLPPPSVATAHVFTTCFCASSTHENGSRCVHEATEYEEVQPITSSYRPPSPIAQSFLPQPEHEPRPQESESSLCYHITPAPEHPPCYNPQPQTTTSQPPPSLTPPTSEYSSDAENNNPNHQRGCESRQQDQPVDSEAINDIKVSVVYTYDALLVTDGRSKNKSAKKQPPSSPIPSERDDESCDDPGEAAREGCSKTGRFVCSECGKKYATSSNLSRHKQTHRSLDSQSAKKCVTCGKAYVSMPALAMHLLTHKLSHACGVCGKLFSRPWLLQGHLRSHSGEKPFGCAHCGKAFADRSNLRAHMQTHSSDKNYTCTRCHKSFALKSYLNKHLESACFKDGEDGDDSFHGSADGENCSEVDVEAV